MDARVDDIPTDAFDNAPHLTAEQAFAIFGLPSGSGRAQIRARYRRLAFLHHPDRNGGSPESFARFRRIARALHTLEAWLQTIDRGDAYGVCPRCQKQGATHRGLDGRTFCRDCLVSAVGRRYLPAPPAVMASCAFATATLAAALVALVFFLTTARTPYGLLAVACSVSGLLFLAILALLVGQVQRTPRPTRGSAPWR